MVVLGPRLLSSKHAVVAQATVGHTLRANHVIARVARARHADVSAVLRALLISGDLTVRAAARVEIALMCYGVEVTPRIKTRRALSVAVTWAVCARRTVAKVTGAITLLLRARLRSIGTVV